MPDEVEVTDGPQAIIPKALSGFEAFSKVMVSTMKEVAQLTENGVSNFLLALGTTILILGIFLKLRPFGVQISDLTPAEFITVMILCALLLFSGAYLRLYQHQKAGEISRRLTEAGTRIIEKSVDTSARIQEKGMETAAGMVKQPPPSGL